MVPAKVARSRAAKSWTRAPSGIEIRWTTRTWSAACQNPLWVFGAGAIQQRQQDQIRASLAREGARFYRDGPTNTHLMRLCRRAWETICKQAVLAIENRGWRGERKSQSAGGAGLGLPSRVSSRQDGLGPPLLAPSAYCVAKVVVLMMPAFGEECWAALGTNPCCSEPWTRVEARPLVENTITLPVQINGRKRGVCHRSSRCHSRSKCCTIRDRVRVWALDAANGLDGGPPKSDRGSAKDRQCGGMIRVGFYSSLPRSRVGPGEAAAGPTVSGPKADARHRRLAIDALAGGASDHFMASNQQRRPDLARPQLSAVGTSSRIQARGDDERGSRSKAANRSLRLMGGGYADATHQPLR